MLKYITLPRFIILLVGTFLFMLGAVPSPAMANSATAADPLQTVWQAVAHTKNYQFEAYIEQTLIPRPSPHMIGETSTELNFNLQGRAFPPDQLALTLQLIGYAPMVRHGDMGCQHYCYLVIE